MPNQLNFGAYNSDFSENHKNDINYTSEHCTPDLSLAMDSLGMNSAVDKVSHHNESNSHIELPALKKIAPSNNDSSESLCQPPVCLSTAQSSYSPTKSFHLPFIRQIPIQHKLLEERSNQYPINQSPIGVNSANRALNVAPDDSVVVPPNLTLVKIDDWMQLNQKVEQQAVWMARSETQIKALEEALKEQRSQLQKTDSLSTWRGTISKMETSASAQTVPHPSSATGYIKAPNQTTPNQTVPFQKRNTKQHSVKQRDAKQQNWKQHNAKPRRDGNTPRAYLPEPALQSKTYQLPNRSEKVTAINRVMCSMPRTVLLFLLGTLLACAVGLIYPYTVSWMTLSGIVSNLIRGLALAILFSLTTSFVLEFR